MAELLTPEKVFTRFNTLRSSVVDVIREGEQLARQLPAVSEAGKRFEAAQRIVSSSSLSLVVLGAEGSGKSTMVRGILGIELSPIEADEAGTVAPVYLTYGHSDAPTFQIEFLDGRPSELCSKQQYCDYIRQSTNPDNEKRVLRALVQVKNPLLAHGLVLVDMPGTGGYSETVREQAQDFIRSQTAAVIGVASVRTYAPLIDIARMLVGGDGRLTFQAVVSNRWSDTFLKDTRSMQPLTAEEVAATIEESRRKGYALIVKRMRELGLEDALTEDVLFVFSANTLYEREGPIATAPHLREIERFLDRVARYVQENGVAFAIQGAAREGEAVLGTLKSYVNLRRDILQRILAGDRGLLRLFRENRLAAMSSLWTDKAYGEARMQYLREAAWSEFYGKLTTHRRKTVTDIQRLTAELQALPKGTASGVIRDKVARVRAENADQVSALNAELSGILCRAIEALTADANKVLARALDNLPIFEMHGAVGVQITPEDAVHVAISEIGSGRKLAKLAGGALGAAGGFLAGKGAALMLVPDPSGVTQLIGLVLGGAGAWYAIDRAITRFFGSEADAAVKELNRMRDKINNENVREQQALKQHVTASVDRVGAAVHGALMRRLTEIEALIQDPGDDRSRIGEEVATLDHLHAAIEGLERRLLGVRNEARRLAQATGGN
jgi:hypothetical protein